MSHNDGDRQYGINEIKAVLPQGYPFLLVDRVISMKKSEIIDAYKNLSVNEPFFQGHFKDVPVMPGVLIVEALAQAGAFCVLCDEKNRNKIPFLAGVEKFKFKGMAVPGDRLDLHVEMVSQKQDFGLAKARATVGEKIIATGEILFYLMDRKEVGK